MAAHTFNASEIELRRKLLREELDALEAEKLKNLGSMQVVDYHHPERSPGWPIYRHQPFPQMLYHPTMKDESIEQRRLGIRRRNEANPHLAPMDIPPSEPLTIKVADEAAKKLALADGYVELPPTRQLIDAKSPLEVIGRAEINPLLGTRTTLSVSDIIKLNLMPKEDLLKEAREIYGLTVADEASKVEIITAIQEGVLHAANAA
jgi:hypothetical protein